MRYPARYLSKRTSLATSQTEKKGRCRSCRKMFLEPDEPPSRKPTSIVQGVTRLHVCAMPVSSKAMCFQTVTPNLSTSVRSVRERLPMERRTSRSSDSCTHVHALLLDENAVMAKGKARHLVPPLPFLCRGNKLCACVIAMSPIVIPMDHNSS